MQHERLVNALKKAGATIVQDERRSSSFSAHKGTRSIYWHTQQGFPIEEKLAAICVHTASPHTDVQTDCFCDTYHHTIKEAVRALG